MSTVQFSTVAHVTGVCTSYVDLTSRLPWLYLILAAGSRVLYIGETYEQGGLVGRLASHFGPFVTSTLRQRAEEITRARRVRAPFVIVAARLPFEEEDVVLDATSKQVRLALESLLHELVGREFVSRQPEWTIVSTPTGSRISITQQMTDACRSIFDCFTSSHSFLMPFSLAMPYQLVVLEERTSMPIPAEGDLGRLLEEVEMSLYSWMLGKLKSEYGDTWWVDGIPENIRIQCVTRREQEMGGEALPPEAYLTLIDLRDIARKNWHSFQILFERVSGGSGKDRASLWLVELNETRKLWAHPIKRAHAPVDVARIVSIRSLCTRVREALDREKPSDV